MTEFPENRILHDDFRLRRHLAKLMRVNCWWWSNLAKLSQQKLTPLPAETWKKLKVDSINVERRLNPVTSPTVFGRQPFYVVVWNMSKYRWHMTVSRFLRKCSILQPIFESLCRNTQNFAWCLKNYKFKGDSSYPPPHLTDLGVSGLFLVTPIKQIRGVVGFILQPDLKPPKIVLDPTINTERDESSQSHHSVSTALLPSVINIRVHKCSDPVWLALLKYFCRSHICPDAVTTVLSKNKKCIALISQLVSDKTFSDLISPTQRVKRFFACHQ